MFLIIRGIEVAVVSLKLDELKPGMILAEPVRNQFGSLLLDKDTSLTKKRIWMLKTWGIDKVSVKGKPNDPVMETIMKAAARQLQKSLNDTDAQNKPS